MLLSDRILQITEFLKPIYSFVFECFEEIQKTSLQVDQKFQTFHVQIKIQTFVPMKYDALP